MEIETNLDQLPQLSGYTTTRVGKISTFSCSTNKWLSRDVIVAMLVDESK